MAILESGILAVLMNGATHVLDLNGNEATIYYETDTTVHMLLPDGTARSGTWRLNDTGYSVDWQGGPSAVWTLEHEPGSIVYVNPEGTIRAPLLRVVYGNPAQLPR